jgi:hypothetical protein
MLPTPTLLQQENTLKTIKKSSYTSYFCCSKQTPKKPKYNFKNQICFATRKHTNKDKQNKKI